MLHVEVPVEEPVLNKVMATQENSVNEKWIHPMTRLKALGEEIMRTHPGTKQSFCLEYEKSSFIEGVRKIVLTRNIDFIVMGTKGSSRETMKPIGKNTVEVITRVKCPVLVIPERARYIRPKNVVFPTDFNMLYKNRVLNTLSEILKTHNSALRILNIRKRNEDLSLLQQKNKEFLLDSLLHVSYSLHAPVHPCIEKALQEFVDHNPIDMIAMVAKNLNFFQQILFRPLTREINYPKKIPILVLHE